jgi:hypothetical protein
LRAHLCHPWILWNDASTELSKPNHWASYDLSQIITECQTLEARTRLHRTRPRDLYPAVDEADTESDVTPILHDRQLSEASTVVPSQQTQAGQASIEEMVAKSIVLRSNSNALIEPVAADWAAALPTSAGLAGPSIAIPGTSPDADKHGPPFARVLLSLQQENRLLKNDLNFETWLSKENVKHIERLYQSRVLSKNAENERQALVRSIKFSSQIRVHISSLSLSLISFENTECRWSNWRTSSGSTRRKVPPPKASSLNTAMS